MGYYAAAKVDFKKEEDKYPMEFFQEVFLDPENNFDIRLALYVAKELNTFEVSSGKNIRRIWIDIATMNFFVLVCCDDHNEMIGLNDIGLILLKKYSSMSPNTDLIDLSKKIMTIGDRPEIEIDDDYLGFFAGEEKYGYIIKFVE